MARPRSLDNLLATYPPDVQALASATRQFVTRVLPGAAETCDVSARLLAYSYGPGYRGMVATIILSQSGVKLGIVGGAALPDPRGCLEGTGKVHRYVALRNVADLRRAGISALLKASKRQCDERLRSAATRVKPAARTSRVTHEPRRRA